MIKLQAHWNTANFKTGSKNIYIKKTLKKLFNNVKRERWICIIYGRIELKNVQTF